MAPKGRSRITKQPQTVSIESARLSLRSSAEKAQRAATTSSSAKDVTTATTPKVSPSSAATKDMSTATTPKVSSLVPKPRALAIPNTTKTSLSTSSLKDSSIEPMGGLASVVSAFTKAFPYMLIEYCLLILVIEANVTLAFIIGILLTAIGIVYWQRPNVIDALLSSQQWQSVSDWIGDRSNVAKSIGLAGAAMLAWTLWNSTSVAIFSVLSLLLLLGGLLMLLLAQLQAHPELEKDIAQA